MPLLQWTPALSVNVGSIDNEHQALVGMINELHDAMLTGKAKDVLEGIIARLASYAVGHFGHEEKVMQAISFPGYKAHKAEHEAFLSKVGDFKKDFAAGKVMLTLDIINFLKDWLKRHIQGTDKQYSEAFVKNGYN